MNNLGLDTNGERVKRSVIDNVPAYIDLWLDILVLKLTCILTLVFFPRLPEHQLDTEATCHSKSLAPESIPPCALQKYMTHL